MNTIAKLMQNAITTMDTSDFTPANMWAEVIPGSELRPSRVAGLIGDINNYEDRLERMENWTGTIDDQRGFVNRMRNLDLRLIALKRDLRGVELELVALR